MFILDESILNIVVLEDNVRFKLFFGFVFWNFILIKLFFCGVEVKVVYDID